ncbi:Pao retrotransposon peptidase [Oesophagostomum dentatum]|uniref:Pao retrotransposon peptidase n=1 Tax=Oesophagostomum dentatum TaxID=61180 RepID=A0A0B1TRE4_OESDE|nr:Pao retrotransposon peptidase [Oesophagostomum dentatum]
MDYQPVHLLDSGAQRSFIKSQFSRGLKLSVLRSTSFTTPGMGELHENFSSDEVQITLKGLHSSKKLKKLSVHTKEKLITSLKTAQLSENGVKFISTRKIHIAQQTETLSRTSVSPDIFIGQDLLSSIIDHSSPPCHMENGFRSNPRRPSMVATPNVSSKDDYKQDIKHLYELEALGIKTEDDPDKDSVLKFMEGYRKTIEIKDQTITAGFPFKYNAEKLNDNFNIVIRRLQALLRTLQKDKDKLKLYNETLQAYAKEGIIEECEEQPSGITSRKKYPSERNCPNLCMSTTSFCKETMQRDNADELFKKHISSKQVFSSIGMNLREYLSNSKEVDEKISESYRAKSPEVKVLGQIWNAVSDTLKLKCIDNEHTRVTKRTILSQINGFCFDPLGLLTPLIVPAKVPLQDVHKQKLGWDETLPAEEQRRWMRIKNDIVGFTKSIPRKVLDKAFKAKYDLSIFVDSSKRAYACGLYITTISEDESKCTQLFVGKSKIAPLKKDQTKIGFTAERVRQTSQLTFLYVLTEENAADCATRGVNKSEFAKCHWWTGTKWLNDSIERWPVTQMSDLREELEDSETLALQAVQDTEERIESVWPIETITSFPKLKRVVAYCLRFIRSASKDKRMALSDESVQTTTPNAAEIAFAERLIIRQEQQVGHFKIVLDDEGILRKFERLQYDEINDDVISAVCIPKQSLLGKK